VTPKNRACMILLCNSFYLISVMRYYTIPMFLFLSLDLCIEIYFRLFLLFHRISTSQKLNPKTVGISTYSSDKKGIGVVRFWLSFYADAYVQLSLSPPFLDLLLKHAPDPHLLILEPTRLPHKIFLVSCIFLIILIPIASSFWITPLIWWVGWLVELWGRRWRHFCCHLTAQILRRRRRMQGQGGGDVYMPRECDGT
jgi:hypothetical protein